MNQRKIILLILGIAVLSTTLAFGNSGPVTWFQYPGISVITIDEESPISVVNETLHFDFSEEAHDDFSLMGQVSAKYEMKNTRDEKIKSRMVFPFIKNMWGVEKDQILVLVDGKPIDYKIYYGEPAGSISSNGNLEETVELQDILKSITDEKYAPKNFQYQETGRLYRIYFEKGREENLHAVATFKTETNSPRILAKGNNSYAYSSQGNEFSLGTWVGEEQKVMEIFSLDEDLKLNISGYESGASDAAQVTDFTAEVEEIQMDIETYLLDFIADDLDRNRAYNVPDDKNVFYKALDHALERGHFIPEDEISSRLIAPRYVLIAYEVEFDTLQEKSVEVRYPSLGSMDKRDTLNPTYTYNYFLHPAKYWKDFQNLTIKITPSKEYPYVLRSNLPLVMEEDGTYMGTFETLPEEDLSFTLYEKKEITPTEKIESWMDKNLYFLILIGFVIFGVFLLLLVFRFFRGSSNPINFNVKK